MEKREKENKEGKKKKKNQPAVHAKPDRKDAILLGHQRPRLANEQRLLKSSVWIKASVLSGSAQPGDWDAVWASVELQSEMCLSLSHSLPYSPAARIHRIGCTCCKWEGVNQDGRRDAEENCGSHVSRWWRGYSSREDCQMGGGRSCCQWSKCWTRSMEALLIENQNTADKAAVYWTTSLGGARWHLV